MVRKIYLAKIYFTDLSQSKIRPVLVIKEIGEDTLCLQLTSQLKDSKLKVSNDDLIEGSLKKESLVIVPKNFTLHKSILFKYIATINDNKFKEVYKTFCNELECK